MTEALCIACGVEEPAPVICHTCTDRARRHLDTIGKSRYMLDPTPSTNRGGRATGKPGSRPPANLTVIAMTDIRSHALIDPVTCEHDIDDVTNVDGLIVEQARNVISQRQLASPLRDIFDAIRIININFDWLVRTPEADDFLAVLEDCAVGLRRALHEGGREGIGRCTAPSIYHDAAACGGLLTLTWDGQLPEDPTKQTAPTGVTCQTCGDTWNILDLVNIGRVVPLKVWETPPRIAAMLGMPERTLRHWIATNKVHKNGLGMVCHAEVWSILKEPNGPQPLQTTGGPSPLIAQEAT